MGDSLEAQLAAWEFEKEESQQRRARHRHNAPVLLKAGGIEFESKNDGAHLIVEKRWDFWPGTGLFVDRQTKKRSRGVFNLIRIVKRDRGK